MSNEIVSTVKTTQEETAGSKQEEIFEELPDEVSEIIEKLDPDDRKVITKSFQLMMSGFTPSPITPIIKKLTPEHITKIIDYSESEDKRHYRYASWNRFYFTLYVLAAIAVFIFLTIYLSKGNMDLYIKIVELLIAFAGGFGLGVGYKNSKK